MSKKIAITYGDNLGIGPEILNTILEKDLLSQYDCEFHIIGSPEYVSHSDDIKVIQSEATEGDHSFANLQYAIDKCIAGEYQGLVTGPISKDKWIKAGHNYKGQTELLSRMTGCDAEMLFWADGGEEMSQAWKILLLTRHIPLSEVPGALTFERFSQATFTARQFLENIGVQNSSIAVASLNPHAGENGEIGHEEKEIWPEWIEQLGLAGVYSPDQIWIESSQAYLKGDKQVHDLYLAPYHDQVLPLIKSITNLQAVNVSIGLPFIRTSPDHGTAYHLVGKGISDYRPFLKAIDLAVRLS